MIGRRTTHNKEIQMVSSKSKQSSVAFSIVIALVLFAVPSIGDASNVRHPGQQGIAKLSGAWWVWAFEHAFPQDGEGDVDCAVGQSGGTWFLAGTGGGADERNCTIPVGKRLFLPLVNQTIFFEEGIDPDVFDLSLESKRIFLDSRIGGGSSSDDPAVADLYDFLNLFFPFFSTVACDLHATLDGERLIFTTSIVRTQSGTVTIRGDEEALADGFHVLLRPLRAGLHVLEFGGAFCDAENLEDRAFETTVIYHLNVVDGDDNN
jgi:hypothetical protein